MLHLAFLRGEGFSAEKIRRGVGALTKYVKAGVCEAERVPVTFFLAVQRWSIPGGRWRLSVHIFVRRFLICCE
jgi:hypothetical protein